MIFYTAGHVTRAVVGAAHTPYAAANGIWERSLGRYRSALDAHWKPYLEGAATMDDALVSLVRAATRTGPTDLARDASEFDRPSGTSLHCSTSLFP